MTIVFEKGTGSAGLLARQVAAVCQPRGRAAAVAARAPLRSVDAGLVVFIRTLTPAGNVSQMFCLPGFVTYDSESVLTYFQWLPPMDKCAQRIASTGRRRPITGPAFSSDLSDYK